mgnify:CR=1 FL=1
MRSGRKLRKLQRKRYNINRYTLKGKLFFLILYCILRKGIFMRERLLEKRGFCMSGKRAAIILVSIMLLVSILVIVAITIFYATYEPTINQSILPFELSHSNNTI